MTSDIRRDGRWWTHDEDDDGLLRRAVTMSDAAGVLSVHGDSRVYVHDPHETHVDLAQSQRFLTPMVDHWREHGFGYWAVLAPREWWPSGVLGQEPSDGGRIHAGLGGIQHHSVGGRPVLNVYFRLAPAVQGRGIARRIVSAAIRMAPHVAAGVDVVVRTRPANLAARRVAVRAGFTDEGMEPGTSDMQLLRLAADRLPPALASSSCRP